MCTRSLEPPSPVIYAKAARAHNACALANRAIVVGDGSHAFPKIVLDPPLPRTSQSHEMTGECPGIPKQQTHCYMLVPIGKAANFCMSGLPSPNFKTSAAEYNSASPAPRKTNEYSVSCPGSLSGAGQIGMGDNVGINPVPWKSSWCIARPHFKTQRHTKS